MKYVQYKYKILLDKGEWQTPDVQEILALRVKMRTIKSTAKGKNGSRKHNYEKSKQGALTSNQGEPKSKFKHNYF